MGCCLSRDEDRFEDRSALLSKEQTTREALEAAERIKAKQLAVGNGAYSKPVTSVSDHTKTLSPPAAKKEAASSCCSGGSCSSKAGAKNNGATAAPSQSVKPPQKKPEEQVHPTVDSVDLLGLDQPPSPPNAPSFAKVVTSPVRATTAAKPLSPRRSSSVSFANDEADGSYTASAPSPITVGSPQEVLSSLMPPRPSPPPTPLVTNASAPPPVQAPAPATAEKLEQSVDLEDDNENGDGDGDDDDAAPPASASTASSSSNASKSKKKKKKKGKK